MYHTLSADPVARMYSLYGLKAKQLTSATCASTTWLGLEGLLVRASQLNRESNTLAIHGTSGDHNVLEASNTYRQGSLIKFRSQLWTLCVTTLQGVVTTLQGVQAYIFPPYQAKITPDTCKYINKHDLVITLVSHHLYGYGHRTLMSNRIPFLLLWRLIYYNREAVWTQTVAFPYPALPYKDSKFVRVNSRLM